MIKIRKLRKSDVRETAKLIADTFGKYNKGEGPKKAIEKYVGFYTIKNEKDVKRLTELFSESPICFVALKNDKIIGVVRGRNDRVRNLFVNGKYHGKGIGRKLMEIFEKECKKQKSKNIRIYASLYAIPFYQKLGYKKSTGLRSMHLIEGLKCQPMKKKLD